MSKLLENAVLLAIVCLASNAASAQSTAPASTSAPQTRINDVIRRLSDADFSTRKKASEELAALPPEAYDIFVKMLADPETDAEIRTRLTEALPALQLKSAKHIVELRDRQDLESDR